MANFTEAALIQKGNEVTGFDPRKLSKNTIRILLIGAICLGLYVWLAPEIKDLVWDTVSIANGLVGLGIFSIILFALWKNIGTMCDIASKTLLGWLIEYDPWVLQEKVIDQAEEDMETMIREKEKISAKFIELSNKVETAKNEVAEGKAAALIAQKAVRPDMSDEQKLQLQQQIGDQIGRANRNQVYIDNISPLITDMDTILKVVKTGSIVLKHKIQNSRADLKQLKDTYESATAGANALNAMKKALTGNIDLNNKAEQSKLNVLKNISLSIGQMRTSMEIISDITADANLNDQAKMKVAKDKLLELGIGDGSSAMPVQSANFKNIVPLNATSYGQLPD